MILCLSSILQATTAPVLADLDDATLRKYKQEAQTAARTAHRAVEDVVSTDIEQNKMKDAIGYRGIEVSGAGLGIEAAEDKGRLLRDTGNGGKCTNKSCDISSVSSTSAMLERDKNIEEVGFIKSADGTIMDNKGYLDKPLQAAHKAAGKFDFLTGNYADCKADDKVAKLETLEVCDEYYDIKHGSCNISQIVEIEPRYNYECHKKREVQEKKCTDEITKLTCKQNAECDSGGIVLKSLASDMGWTYNYPVLTLGTVASDYWRSRCGSFIRSTTFEVKNKKLIEEFRITEVGYDDYLRILVNGSQVYNGPFGGDKLAIVVGGFWRRVDCGSGGIHGCELNTSRYASVSIDLIPYLKEGINELVMEVIVGGAGEGWMRIIAKQHCCTEWIEEREERCAYLE